MMQRNAIAALVAATVLLAGCAATPDQGERGSGPSGELTIFAAASLVDPFTELAVEFAAQHPRVDVRPIVFDGSATLAAQIAEGAPAHVFASADLASMMRVEAELADDPTEFANNILQLAVAPGNPHAITALTDLDDPALRVVLCAEDVPCGAASRTLLAMAGVSVDPASEEQNVKAVLTKVLLGEADAGLVYATDLHPGAAVDAVPIDGAERAANTYSIAVLDEAGSRAAADAFVRLVLSATGRAVLKKYGFGVE